MDRIPEGVLFHVGPLIETEITIKHSQLEALYTAGERDGVELSIKLAEIVALKTFLLKLRSSERKVNQQTKNIIEGKNNG